MSNKRLGDWQKLCQLAVLERDPDRLMALIREIDRILAEQEKRQESKQGKARNAA